MHLAWVRMHLDLHASEYLNTTELNSFAFCMPTVQTQHALCIQSLATLLHDILTAVLKCADNVSSTEHLAVPFLA